MMIGIIVAVILLVLLGAIIYFYNEVIKIKVTPYEETRDSEVTAGHFEQEEFDSLPKEDITIPSPRGYSLQGSYIPVENATATVIIVHGVQVSRWHSVKYLHLFRKRGFNVLLYDHCRHGMSGGDYTTYGLYEKQDLRAVVDWVVARNGPDAVIGIHGESMGAATALQHAAIDDRPAFYIADCPYSTIWGQMAYRLKVEYHLPSFPLLHLTSLVCLLRTGMSFGKVSPLRDIATVTTPVLFIHGDADDYVPTQMTIDMYKVKPDPKQLHLAPGANHAQAFISNREKYDQVIEEFLQSIPLTIRA